MSCKRAIQRLFTARWQDVARGGQRDGEENEAILVITGPSLFGNVVSNPEQANSPSQKAGPRRLEDDSSRIR
jgi:hypothetical protein